MLTLFKEPTERRRCPMCGRYILVLKTDELALHAPNATQVIRILSPGGIENRCLGSGPK